MFGGAGGKVSGCCCKVAGTDKGVQAAIRIGAAEHVTLQWFLVRLGPRC